MIRRLRRFHREDRGAAAVELALIAPVIAFVALLSFDVWYKASLQRDEAAALDTGIDYYIGGGSDDASAQAVAMSAWNNAPADASVVVTRECRCGTATLACSSTCSSSGAPATYVRLTASGTLGYIAGSQTHTVERVLRVK